ncbi:hypothetical protein BH24CHL6_BH24CHL6_12940 [soil metagenome]
MSAEGRAEEREDTGTPGAQIEQNKPTGQPSDAARGDDTSSGLAGVRSSIAGAAGPVISAARRPVDQLASGARRLIDDRSSAPVRQARRMGRQPLLNLWEVHPEARRAALREQGLQTVPVAQIKGTAVEGAAQRGGDFLPLRNRRSDDWRARWQRILKGVEGLVSLPPIELLRHGDEYWVLDGHNRVAAALYTGQVAMDATVHELRLPGVTSGRAHSNIAPYLEGSRDVRAAGSGRFSRTSTRPDVRRAPRAAPNEDDGAGTRQADDGKAE